MNPNNPDFMASSSTLIASTSRLEVSILDEECFRRTIAFERKRTERSKNPFLLVLLDAGHCLPSDKNGRVLRSMLSALSSATRATDVIGWYKDHRIVGVMFTEIKIDARGTILNTMMNRVIGALQRTLTLEKFSQVGISFHVFPEDWQYENAHGNLALYPDLLHREKAQMAYRTLKRLMDIMGSAAALLLLAPLFLTVAALVKLSSKGPILFKQERLGQFGKAFTFLKFRSMYVNNDRRIHQEFMKKVISGSNDGKHRDERGAVYKMTNDPRVTKVGRILRRTSLDELPQFINVLKGDMSLVGPRPPLAYECEIYDLWHRRRVLEVKPGITGLWQVKGRSRVRFDDMVRLDLQYVHTRSLWLDILILMQTPKAILFGGDAF
jgi:lipopolysaccharide/colanic/teichoic acid biosynthesis glycosyltransferase